MRGKKKILPLIIAAILLTGCGCTKGEIYEKEFREEKTAPNMSVTPHDISFSIPAKDKEHAIKIARDLRFKYYAEKYGL